MAIYGHDINVSSFLSTSHKHIHETKIEKGMLNLLNCWKTWHWMHLIFIRYSLESVSHGSCWVQMLGLCDDHLSLYQLTLERGTALFKKVMDRELVNTFYLNLCGDIVWTMSNIHVLILRFLFCWEAFPSLGCDITNVWKW